MCVLLYMLFLARGLGTIEHDTVCVCAEIGSISCCNFVFHEWEFFFPLFFSAQFYWEDDIYIFVDPASLFPLPLYASPKNVFQ